MAAPVATAPVVFSGNSVALMFDAGGGAKLEVPMVKGELKFSADKGEATSSLSVVNQVVFKEYGRGPTGASFNWDSNWRVGANPAPTELSVGAIYQAWIYFRRPGWNNAADVGGSYNMYLFMDEVSLTFDPRSGVFEWRAGATMTGGYTITN